MPDLFSALPQAKAPASARLARVTAKPDNLVRARHFLPKDLAGALKHLDDAELDSLLAAVATEAARRGRLPPSREKEPQTGPARVEDGVGALTLGKLNAVRAAFKAGVKPSAIARQFGVSQSEVRKALAMERPHRKSGR